MFETRLPVYDDKIIEGTEYLTLQVGEEKATAKVLDNDFVKLKLFKGSDGAEIDVFNSDDPNRGKNPYLLYTVRLQKPVRQAQKFNFQLDDSSTANESDVDLEKKIKFDITKFNSKIPNANKNASISQQDDGTIWVPIGTKEFIAKLPIQDDPIVEGTEHLTLSIGSFNATALIADNDFDDVNISSFHALESNGAERTKGYKRFLSYSLTFDEKLKKQQTLSFSQVFPKDQTNADEDDVILNQIKFKSDKPKKNKDFLLNNGQLVVPKGISSFRAKVKIIDDKIVEGTEKLTLSLANLEATAAITDNDVAVASFQTASNGAEETIGFNDYLSYELTFDEKLKKRQYLTFSQSNPSTQANADENDLFLDKGIRFKSNKPKKDKKFRLNNGVLSVPKGISSFTTDIDIKDDKEIEGEEFLTLSVGDKDATASITDNDFDNIRISTFHANNSNGAELTEGFDNYLSFYLEFEKTLAKDQNIAFTQADAQAIDAADENDVFLGPNISFSSADNFTDIANYTENMSVREEIYLLG